METEKFIGTGKRKSSIARVCMLEGKGDVKVNNKEISEYFSSESEVSYSLYPLEMTELDKKYDVKVNVAGGGLMGQAGAIRHAISNTILQANPNLRLVLKRAGLLTRDARIKERKKYGQKGARKKFQFSKR
ncbi:MAG: 30S ribosomal protein S9 [Nitrospinota bacterium]|nr:30S ribosomal protein S9 [Nitrospinota bacterium]